MSKRQNPFGDDSCVTDLIALSQQDDPRSVKVPRTVIEHYRPLHMGVAGLLHPLYVSAVVRSDGPHMLRHLKGGVAMMAALLGPDRPVRVAPDGEDAVLVPSPRLGVEVRVDPHGLRVPPPTQQQPRVEGRGFPHVDDIGDCVAPELRDDVLHAMREALPRHGEVDAAIEAALFDGGAPRVVDVGREGDPLATWFDEYIRTYGHDDQWLIDRLVGTRRIAAYHEALLEADQLRTIVLSGARIDERWPRQSDRLTPVWRPTSTGWEIAFVSGHQLILLPRPTERAGRAPTRSTPAEQSEAEPAEAPPQLAIPPQTAATALTGVAAVVTALLVALGGYMGWVLWARTNGFWPACGTAVVLGVAWWTARRAWAGFRSARRLRRRRSQHGRR